MTPTPSIQLTVPKGWKQTQADKRLSDAFHKVLDLPWYHRLQSWPVWVCIIAGAIIATSLIGAAQAADPYGYSVWCTENTRNCHDIEPATLKYSDDLYFFLDDQRREVGFAIRYEPDAGVDTWRFPDRGVGDCEDFVIGLIRRLEENGILRGTMRLARGLDEYGRGHAFLVIATDDGLYAMDRYEVKPIGRFHATLLWVEDFRSNSILPTRTSIIHTQSKE